MSREIVDYMRALQPGYHDGWGAREYSGWQDEQLSWKTDCYLGDWSFLQDLEVTGPDALKLFSDTCVNSFANFAIGQAKHIVQCNSAGKVIAEGVLMRHAEDRFTTQSTPALYTAFVASKGGYDVQWREIETFQYQVSGPKALAVCEKVVGHPLTDVKFMRFADTTIAGCKVQALRQGMAGEIGFEFHGTAADAAAVKAALLEVGADFGMRQLGARTAMINHLEAAFPTGMWNFLKDFFTPDVAGYNEFIGRTFDLGELRPVLRGSFVGDDITDYFKSPYELGWGKSVKFDHDFMGRAALEAEAAAGTHRRRVTLEFNADDVVDIYASMFRDGQPFEFMDIPHPQRWITWADRIERDGALVGISTVPGYSLWFRKVLALAYVDPQFAEPGTSVEVIWGAFGTPQKRIRAIVQPAPYKQDNRRADLNNVVETPATA